MTIETLEKAQGIISLLKEYEKSLKDLENV